MTAAQVPEPTAEQLAKLPLRIQQRISVDDAGCWIWTGNMDHTGYGRTSRMDDYKRKTASHRLVYEVLVGPIPEGLDADHLCRVRACCNPEHIEPVTRRENVAVRGKTVTAENARKTHCPYGHEYSGNNLLIDARRKRVCRECGRRKHWENVERVGGIEAFRKIDRERAARYYAARQAKKRDAA